MQQFFARAGSLDSTGSLPSDVSFSACELEPQAAVDSLPALYQPLYQLRPEVLAEVQLGRLIGTGSSGRCYHGLWQGGRVAVKVMDHWLDRCGSSSLERADSSQSDIGCAKAAVVEALLSRCLSHPHIVPTFACGVSTQEQADGRLHQQVWIVQAYCNRGTLLSAVERGAFMASDGSPDLQAVLATAVEIAGAVSYLHSRGVLHGDLTASNVLLVSSVKDARRWVAQVADFGLAQTNIHEGHVDTPSFGTVTHMPPELLADGKLSQATDVYSFGCLLLEMCTGQRAWAGCTDLQVLQQVAHRRQGLEVPDGIPPALHSLVHRCLSPVPAVRPPFSQILPEVQALLQAIRRPERQLPRAASSLSLA